MDVSALVSAAAAAAASASLVKVLTEAVSGWLRVRRKTSRIEIRHPDGTSISVPFDPSQEESVRRLLSELDKAASENKAKAIDRGGENG